MKGDKEDMWIEKDLKQGDKVKLMQDFSTKLGTMRKGTIATIINVSNKGYDIIDNNNGQMLLEIGFEGLKKINKDKENKETDKEDTYER